MAGVPLGGCTEEYFRAYPGNASSMYAIPSAVPLGMHSIPSAVPLGMHGIPSAVPLGMHGIPSAVPLGMHSIPSAVPLGMQGIPSAVPLGMHGIPSAVPLGMQGIPSAVPLGMHGIPSAVPLESVTVLDDNTQAFSGYLHASLGRTNVDWQETTTEHVFKVDIPGLRKKDVQLQVEDGRMLTISGHHKKENVREAEKWHRKERSEGYFMRKYLLPENANLDAVTAKVASGVLTVVVPKLHKDAHGPRTIEIGGWDEPAEVMQAGQSKQPSQAGPSKQPHEAGPSKSRE